MLRPLLRAIAVLAVSSAAVPVAVVTTILASFLFLPLPATLPDPRPAEGGQISRVVTVTGEEIGQFREFEQNIPFAREDIPEHLKQAVISAEDRNFYRHTGVDLTGSARALWHDIRGRSFAQGGSTITQQYVKNAYTSKERTLTRKVREAILASQLDRQLDKEEILYKYLSSIYLGEGAYGVAAASETYFRKPVRDLNVSEAALLAGLIPAPSRYEPRGNPELAEQKRQIVLRKMLEQGYIDREAYNVATLQRVFVVTAQNPTPPPGQPATFVHPAREAPTEYPYFLDYVKRYLLERLDDEVVFKGGLTIVTTLDPELQHAAERARDEAIGRLGPATYEDCAGGKGQPCERKETPLEMSIVSIEPPTGYVKALIGGRDFNAAGGQVNLALGGCPPEGMTRGEVAVPAGCWSDDSDFIAGGGTGRQPGSAWKPVILAAAFAEGIPPTKAYAGSSPYTFPSGSISNFGGASYGSMSLRAATHRSVNTAYARLLQDVGLKDAGEMARKLGINSTFIDGNKGLSYALGVDSVSPLEMAGAYAVFANRGKRVAPTPVLQVKDPAGKILIDNTSPSGEEVIDEAVADNVTDVLRGVITGGTGTRANIGRPAAGKTGTAQDSSDSWFAGFTPTLSTAVWMGYRDKKLPMRNIPPCGRAMTGGCLPAITWRAFMAEALKDVPVTEFSEPAPIRRLADELRRKERQGFDPGPRREPVETDMGGPYVQEPPKPTATPPSTTSTTVAPDDDDGDEDDGFRLPDPPSG